jgi:hypothetical protein
MLKVGEVLVSDDIRDREFVCNLEKCKGACCVEGDFGAPLLEEELAILEEIYPKIKKYLSKEGIAEIERTGTHTVDDEGELCTPVIGGRECVYAIYDKKGILKCGIEQAYNDGKKKNFEAVNYHKWHICSPACALGKELQVPVYKFLKEPLIRKYGEAWYNDLVSLIEKNPPKA